MKHLNYAAKFAAAAMMAALSFGVHAQAPAKGASFDVEVQWKAMPNSSPDAVVNEAVVKQVIADGLSSLNIKPSFVKKSNDHVYIKIRVYYLHDAGTETRVLTGVASAMTKAGEVCSVDAYSWHRGNNIPAGNIMDNLKSWMPGFQKNCRLV